MCSALMYFISVLNWHATVVLIVQKDRLQLFVIDLPGMELSFTPAAEGWIISVYGA